ncbi:MAG: AAA family ATPase [Desulfobacterales bacterium]
MRIDTLRLLAFGPFTGHAIDLSGGREGLHLLYGPNEAGKSTTLRALRQLLYGIPPRSGDGFLHPYPKLRIGAELRRGDGQRLSLVRRKGRSNTLRAADDATVLEEARLRAFLGGVEASLFATMFGIDHADLVRGGEEIVRGGGRIGQILFAAGSGITDLRRIQLDLQADADALFLPKGQNPRINRDTALLREKQRAIREAQLSAEEWARHDATHRQALAHKTRVAAELEQVLRQKGHLERIRAALPDIARRRELLEALAEFQKIPRLSADFRGQRQAALARLDSADRDARQAAENCERISRALAELDIPETLLGQAQLIEQQFQDLGSFRKARQDRQRLEGLKAAYERDARDILLTLRPGMSVAAAASELQLDRAASARITELAQQFERLLSRRENSEQTVADLKQRMAALESQLGQLAVLPDTAALQQAVAQAHAAGPLDERLAEAQAEAAQLAAAAAVALERLPLWSGALEALEKLPVPDIETVEAYDLRLADAAARRDRLQADLQATAGALRELEGRLAQLQIEGAVPSEFQLGRVRDRRDRGWQLVRGEWLQGKTIGADTRRFVAELVPDGHLADAYEASVRAADTVADRLRREAERVALLARLTTEKETQGGRRAELEEGLQAAEAACRQLAQEWRALWQPLQVVARGPREMRAWLSRQSDLVRRAAELRERRAAVEMLSRRTAQLRTALGGALAPVAPAAPAAAGADAASLGTLLTGAQGHLDRIARDRERHAQLLQEKARQAAELNEARLRLERTQTELTRWQAAWRAALEPAGLAADTSPAQALAVLEELKLFFDKIREARHLQSRISGIERDAGQFTERVAQLGAATAPDLAGSPADQAAAELYNRLTHARSAMTRCQELERQQRREAASLQSARRRAAEQNDLLDRMCAEAGCQSVAQLAAVEARAEQRQALEAELQALEGQLRALSGGTPLAAFVTAALAEDADRIGPALVRLTDEAARLDREKSELDQTIGREQNELKRMAGSARAAELTEEAEALLAGLETDVGHYVRLRLAATVLSQVIERYRERHQGPILKRSGALFRAMTGGSFQELRLEFDERGDAVLAGVRAATGEVVRVEGMSEGTADQLYLAVRVASLEAYLEQNEAMPFIVDDILIKFDDQRSAAALTCLGELARKTQVIFFTHHRHLVDLARQHLPADLLFVHTLAG